MSIGVYRTFKYRLLPSRSQHKALRQICESQRQLYNAALQERIDCYQKTGKGRSYVDQCRALSEIRKDDKDSSCLPSNLQRWTLRRLDDAYTGFYRRIERGDAAGFPRFRGSGWWDSFGFNEFVGIRFDGKRLRFKGMPGSLRVHMHRPLPEGAVMKSCVFKHDLKGWYVCLQCAVAEKAHGHPGEDVGIDRNAAHFATLSTGETVPAPRMARRTEQELRRRRRALARCQKGSRGRRKVWTQIRRSQQRLRNARRTFLHQQSSRLTAKYRRIGVEEPKSQLPTKASASDASWAAFLNMLTYKAGSAGGEVIRVHQGTMRDACSACGAIVAKDANARMYHCAACGAVLDRSHNNALNILALAVTGRGQVNVAGSRRRSARNISTEPEQSGSV